MNFLQKNFKFACVIAILLLVNGSLLMKHAKERRDPCCTLEKGITVTNFINNHVTCKTFAYGVTGYTHQKDRAE